MKNIVVSAHFHPSKNKWSSLVVEMGVKGSHEEYNVIYNSECNNKYFGTERQAKWIGLEKCGKRGVEKELLEVVIFYKDEIMFKYDTGIRHKIVEFNRLDQAVNSISKFHEIVGAVHISNGIPLNCLNIKKAEDENT